MIRPTSACRSRALPNASAETQRDIADNNLIAPIVGHVGDGNFHLTLLVDMQNPDEIKVAKAFNERLVERALAMDGTCTGEHGVGQGKMKYLLAEHGAPALEAMRAIKKALDPQGIMNPGKSSRRARLFQALRRFDKFVNWLPFGASVLRSTSSPHAGGDGMNSWLVLSLGYSPYGRTAHLRSRLRRSMTSSFLACGCSISRAAFVTPSLS